MKRPPKTKRAAPDRATRDATTHSANDSALSEGVQYAGTPFALADGIGNAQRAVQQATLELIVNGVTLELRAHIVAAERALGIARWATENILAEWGAPC